MAIICPQSFRTVENSHGLLKAKKKTTAEVALVEKMPPFLVERKTPILKAKKKTTLEVALVEKMPSFLGERKTSPWPFSSPLLSTPSSHDHTPHLWYLMVAQSFQCFFLLFLHKHTCIWCILHPFPCAPVESYRR